MLNRIDSEENSRIKLVRKLASKKHRDALGKFVIEGINLVEEAINRGVSIDFILISDEYEENDNFKRLSDIENMNAYVLSSRLFERISDAQKGSGVLAVASRIECSKDDFMKLPTETNILVLDRVQDPGNIGTMIRTAVAAGYGAIAVMKGTADIFSLKVLRATAGMVFDIPIVYFTSPMDLADTVRQMGKKICVTVPLNGNVYYKCNLSSNVALVIGNEGNGISDELVQLADERITIPMSGEVESLNAAVSAAILMYEAVRN